MPTPQDGQPKGTVDVFDVIHNAARKDPRFDPYVYAHSLGSGSRTGKYDLAFDPARTREKYKDDPYYAGPEGQKKLSDDLTSIGGLASLIQTDDFARSYKKASAFRTPTMRDPSTGSTVAQFRDAPLYTSDLGGARKAWGGSETALTLSMGNFIDRHGQKRVMTDRDIRDRAMYYDAEMVTDANGTLTEKPILREAPYEAALYGKQMMSIYGAKPLSRNWVSAFLVDAKNSLGSVVDPLMAAWSNEFGSTNKNRQKVLFDAYRQLSGPVKASTVQSMLERGVMYPEYSLMPSLTGFKDGEEEQFYNLIEELKSDELNVRKRAAGNDPKAKIGADLLDLYEGINGKTWLNRLGDLSYLAKGFLDIPSSQQRDEEGVFGGGEAIASLLGQAVGFIGPQTIAARGLAAGLVKYGGESMVTRSIAAGMRNVLTKTGQRTAAFGSAAVPTLQMGQVVYHGAREAGWNHDEAASISRWSLPMVLLTEGALSAPWMIKSYIGGGGRKEMVAAVAKTLEKAPKDITPASKAMRAMGGVWQFLKEGSDNVGANTLKNALESFGRESTQEMLEEGGYALVEEWKDASTGKDLYAKSRPFDYSLSQRLLDNFGAGGIMGAFMGSFAGGRRKPQLYDEHIAAFVANGHAKDILRAADEMLNDGQITEEDHRVINQSVALSQDVMSGMKVSDPQVLEALMKEKDIANEYAQRSVKAKEGEARIAEIAAKLQENTADTDAEALTREQDSIKQEVADHKAHIARILDGTEVVQRLKNKLLLANSIKKTDVTADSIDGIAARFKQYAADRRTELDAAKMVRGEGAEALNASIDALLSAKPGDTIEAASAMIGQRNTIHKSGALLQEDFDTQLRTIAQKKQEVLAELMKAKPPSSESDTDPQSMQQLAEELMHDGHSDVRDWLSEYERQLSTAGPNEPAVQLYEELKKLEEAERTYGENEADRESNRSQLKTQGELDNGWSQEQLLGRFMESLGTNDELSVNRILSEVSKQAESTDAQLRNLDTAITALDQMINVREQMATSMLKVADAFPGTRVSKLVGEDVPAVAALKEDRAQVYEPASRMDPAFIQGLRDTLQGLRTEHARLDQQLSRRNEQLGKIQQNGNAITFKLVRMYALFDPEVAKNKAFTETVPVLEAIVSKSGWKDPKVDVLVARLKDVVSEQLIGKAKSPSTKKIKWYDAEQKTISIETAGAGSYRSGNVEVSIASNNGQASSGSKWHVNISLPQGNGTFILNSGASQTFDSKEEAAAYAESFINRVESRAEGKNSESNISKAKAFLKHALDTFQWGNEATNQVLNYTESSILNKEDFDNYFNAELLERLDQTSGTGSAVVAILTNFVSEVSRTRYAEVYSAYRAHVATSGGLIPNYEQEQRDLEIISFLQNPDQALTEALIGAKRSRTSDQVSEAKGAAIERSIVMVGQPGVGKTENIPAIISSLSALKGRTLSIAVIAPGRANAKGVVESIQKLNQAHTITEVALHDTAGFEALSNVDVIIVDEAHFADTSDANRFRDLMRNKPEAAALFLGDPMQAPSVASQDEVFPVERRMMRTLPLQVTFRHTNIPMVTAIQELHAQVYRNITQVRMIPELPTMDYIAASNTGIRFVNDQGTTGIYDAFADHLIRSKTQNGVSNDVMLIALRDADRELALSHLRKNAELLGAWDMQHIEARVFTMDKGEHSASGLQCDVSFVAIDPNELGNGYTRYLYTAISRGKEGSVVFMPGGKSRPVATLSRMPSGGNAIKQQWSQSAERSRAIAEDLLPRIPAKKPVPPKPTDPGDPIPKDEGNGNVPKDGDTDGQIAKMTLYAEYVEGSESAIGSTMTMPYNADFPGNREAWNLDNPAYRIRHELLSRVFASSETAKAFRVDVIKKVGAVYNTLDGPFESKEPDAEVHLHLDNESVILLKQIMKKFPELPQMTTEELRGSVYTMIGTLFKSTYAKGSTLDMQQIAMRQQLLDPNIADGQALPGMERLPLKSLYSGLRNLGYTPTYTKYTDFLNTHTKAGVWMSDPYMVPADAKDIAWETPSGIKRSQVMVDVAPFEGGPLTKVFMYGDVVDAAYYTRMIDQVDVAIDKETTSEVVAFGFLQWNRARLVKDGKLVDDALDKFLTVRDGKPEVITRRDTDLAGWSRDLKGALQVLQANTKLSSQLEKVARTNKNKKNANGYDTINSDDYEHLKMSTDRVNMPAFTVDLSSIAKPSSVNTVIDAIDDVSRNKVKDVTASPEVRRQAVADSQEYFRKVFGNRFVDNKLEFKSAVTSRDGRSLWGVMENGRIILEAVDGTVREGVARHEAVHRVIDMLLDPESASKILNEAADLLARKQGLRRWQITDEMIHEFIAEQYEKPAYDTSTLFGRFMRWLKDIFKRWGIHSSRIDDLLYAIEDGAFRDAPERHNQVVRHSPKLSDNEVLQGLTYSMGSNDDAPIRLYTQSQYIPLRNRHFLNEVFGDSVIAQKIVDTIAGQLFLASEYQTPTEVNVTLPLPTLQQAYNNVFGTITKAAEDIDARGLLGLNKADILALDNNRWNQYKKLKLADPAVFNTIVQAVFPGIDVVKMLIEQQMYGRQEMTIDKDVIAGMTNMVHNTNEFLNPFDRQSAITKLALETTRLIVPQTTDVPIENKNVDGVDMQLLQTAFVDAGQMTMYWPGRSTMDIMAERLRAVEKKYPDTKLALHAGTILRRFLDTTGYYKNQQGEKVYSFRYLVENADTMMELYGKTDADKQNIAARIDVAKEMLTNTVRSFAELAGVNRKMTEFRPGEWYEFEGRRYLAQGRMNHRTFGYGSSSETKDEINDMLDRGFVAAGSDAVVLDPEYRKQWKVGLNTDGEGFSITEQGVSTPDGVVLAEAASVGFDLKNRDIEVISGFFQAAGVNLHTKTLESLVKDESGQRLARIIGYWSMAIHASIHQIETGTVDDSLFSLKKLKQNKSAGIGSQTSADLHDARDEEGRSYPLPSTLIGVNESLAEIEQASQGRSHLPRIMSVDGQPVYPVNLGSRRTTLLPSAIEGVYSSKMLEEYAEELLKGDPALKDAEGNWLNPYLDPNHTARISTTFLDMGMKDVSRNFGKDYHRMTQLDIVASQIDTFAQNLLSPGRTERLMLALHPDGDRDNAFFTRIDDMMGADKKLFAIDGKAVRFNVGNISSMVKMAFDYHRRHEDLSKARFQKYGNKMPTIEQALSDTELMLNRDYRIDKVFGIVPGNAISRGEGIYSKSNEMALRAANYSEEAIRKVYQPYVDELNAVLFGPIKKETGKRDVAEGIGFRWQSSVMKNTTPESRVALMEGFFYTHHFNDLFLSAALNGSAMQYKDPQDYIKRSVLMQSPGHAPLIIEGGLGESFDVAIIAEPIYGEKALDGQDYILPWYHNRFRTSFGGKTGVYRNTANKMVIVQNDLDIKSSQLPITYEIYRQNPFVADLLKRSINGSPELLAVWEAAIGDSSKEQFDAATQAVIKAAQGEVDADGVVTKPEIPLIALLVSESNVKMGLRAVNSFRPQATTPERPVHLIRGEDIDHTPEQSIKFYFDFDNLYDSTKEFREQVRKEVIPDMGIAFGEQIQEQFRKGFNEVVALDQRTWDTQEQFDQAAAELEEKFKKLAEIAKKTLIKPAPGGLVSLRVDTRSLRLQVNLERSLSSLRAPFFSQIAALMGIIPEMTLLVDQLNALSSDLTQKYLLEANREIEKMPGDNKTEKVWAWLKKLGVKKTANQGEVGKVVDMLVNPSSSVNHPMLRTRLMEFLANEMTEEAINPKMNGQMFTQISGHGFVVPTVTEETAITTDPEGMQTITTHQVTDSRELRPPSIVNGKYQPGEVMMPFLYAAEFGFEGEAWRDMTFSEIRLDILKRMGEEGVAVFDRVTTVYAFRTPSSGLGSGHLMKVVGFLNESANIIAWPHIANEYTGGDYDGDQMTVYLRRLTAKIDDKTKKHVGTYEDIDMTNEDGTVSIEGIQSRILDTIEAYYMGNEESGIKPVNPEMLLDPVGTARLVKAHEENVSENPELYPEVATELFTPSHSLMAGRMAYDGTVLIGIGAQYMKGYAFLCQAMNHAEEGDGAFMNWKPAIKAGNEWVISNISQLLNGMLDNTKLMIIGRAGVNTHNIGTIMGAVMSGLSLRESLAIAKHPLMVSATRKLDKQNSFTQSDLVRGRKSLMELLMQAPAPVEGEQAPAILPEQLLRYTAIGEAVGRMARIYSLNTNGVPLDDNGFDQLIHDIETTTSSTLQRIVDEDSPSPDYYKSLNTQQRDMALYLSQERLVRSLFDPMKVLATQVNTISHINAVRWARDRYSEALLERHPFMKESFDELCRSIGKNQVLGEEGRKLYNQQKTGFMISLYMNQRYGDMGNAFLAVNGTRKYNIGDVGGQLIYVMEFPKVWKRSVDAILRLPTTHPARVAYNSNAFLNEAEVMGNSALKVQMRNGRRINADARLSEQVRRDAARIDSILGHPDVYTEGHSFSHMLSIYSMLKDRFSFDRNSLAPYIQSTEDDMFGYLLDGMMKGISNDDGSPETMMYPLSNGRQVSVEDLMHEFITALPVTEGQLVPLGTAEKPPVHSDFFAVKRRQGFKNFFNIYDQSYLNVVLSNPSSRMAPQISPLGGNVVENGNVLRGYDRVLHDQMMQGKQHIEFNSDSQLGWDASKPLYLPTGDIVKIVSIDPSGTKAVLDASSLGTPQVVNNEDAPLGVNKVSYAPLATLNGSGMFYHGPFNGMLNGLSIGQGCKRVGMVSESPELRKLGNFLADQDALLQRSGTIKTVHAPERLENGTWMGRIYADGNIEISQSLNGLWTDSTILHEAIHRFTLAALYAPDNQLDPKTRAFKVGMIELYERAKAALPNSDLNGLKNVGEFVADAMTDSEFQEALAGVDSAGKKQNLWRRFISWLHWLMGKPADLTVVEQVMNATKGFIEYSTKTNQSFNRQAARNQLPAANKIADAASFGVHPNRPPVTDIRDLAAYLMTSKKNENPFETIERDALTNDIYNNKINFKNPEQFVDGIRFSTEGMDEQAIRDYIYEHVAPQIQKQFGYRKDDLINIFNSYDWESAWGATFKGVKGEPLDNDNLRKKVADHIDHSDGDTYLLYSWLNDPEKIIAKNGGKDVKVGDLGLSYVPAFDGYDPIVKVRVSSDGKKLVSLVDIVKSDLEDSKDPDVGGKLLSNYATIGFFQNALGMVTTNDEGGMRSFLLGLTAMAMKQANWDIAFKRMKIMGVKGGDFQHRSPWMYDFLHEIKLLKRTSLYAQLPVNIKAVLDDPKLFDAKEYNQDYTRYYTDALELAQRTAREGVGDELSVLHLKSAEELAATGQGGAFTDLIRMKALTHRMNELIRLRKDDVKDDPEYKLVAQAIFELKQRATLGGNSNRDTSKIGANMKNMMDIQSDAMQLAIRANEVSVARIAGIMNPWHDTLEKDIAALDKVVWSEIKGLSASLVDLGWKRYERIYRMSAATEADVALGMDAVYADVDDLWTLKQARTNSVHWNEKDPYTAHLLKTNQLTKAEVFFGNKVATEVQELLAQAQSHHWEMDGVMYRNKQTGVFDKAGADRAAKDFIQKRYPKGSIPVVSAPLSEAVSQGNVKSGLRSLWDSSKNSYDLFDEHYDEGEETPSYKIANRYLGEVPFYESGSNIGGSIRLARMGLKVRGVTGKVILHDAKANERSTQNLEVMLTKLKLAVTRQIVHETETVPVANAVRSVLGSMSINHSVNQKHNLESIDDLTDRLRGGSAGSEKGAVTIGGINMVPLINLVMTYTSMAGVAVNWKVGLASMLYSGIGSVGTAIASNAANDGLAGTKEWGKAAGVLTTKEGHRKMGALMDFYGVWENQETDLAGSYKKTKSRKLLFSGEMLNIMNAYPDRKMRGMAMVAQMFKDGNWEAHTLDKDGNVHYDQKKDRRYYNADGTFTEDGQILVNGLKERMAASGLHGQTMDQPLKAAYDEQSQRLLKWVSDKYIQGGMDASQHSYKNNVWYGRMFTTFRKFLETKVGHWYLRPTFVDPGGNYVVKTKETGEKVEMWEKREITSYLFALVSTAAKAKEGMQAGWGEREKWSKAETRALSRMAIDLTFFALLYAIFSALDPDDEERKEMRRKGIKRSHAEIRFTTMFQDMAMDQFAGSPWSIADTFSGYHGNPIPALGTAKTMLDMVTDPTRIVDLLPGKSTAGDLYDLYQRSEPAE